MISGDVAILKKGGFAWTAASLAREAAVNKDTLFKKGPDGKRRYAEYILLLQQHAKKQTQPKRRPTRDAQLESARDEIAALRDENDRLKLALIEKISDLTIALEKLRISDSSAKDWESKFREIDRA